MKKITLPATNGEFVFPPAEDEAKFIVLYFYPKDATPGCTTEGNDFSALKAEFTKVQAVVYGVSRDSLKSHEKFREKENFTIDLISDVDSLLCNHFEVIKLKKNYGKEYMGIERSTFIISTANGKGEILKEWRKVKVAGHAKDVLQELAKLN